MNTEQITPESATNVDIPKEITANNRIYLTDKDDIIPGENNLVSILFLAGDRADALEPRRLFPTTMPDSFITFLDADGKEICVARKISDLNPDSQKTVRSSLEDYYLVPKILRIQSITEKFGMQHWRVETDRGIRTFDIRNRIHDIRPLRDGRVLVRDTDDNRYVIESLDRLDRASRMQMLADL